MGTLTLHNTADSVGSPQPRVLSLLWLMAVVAFGVFSGRVMRVSAPTEDTPMLSANDRSRWCTIRALVDEGTYQIDRIIRERNAQGRRVWHTIDRVRHRGWDGNEHDYSSKPPLFPTVLAGEYWVIQQVTGATLERDSYFVIRLMLWLTNGAFLVLIWWAVARWLCWWSGSWWTTAVTFSVATLGTFLTTFAVTLNNHLPAAAACAWTVDALICIGRGDRRAWRFAIACGCAALTAANELPALSLLVSVAVYLCWLSPRQFLVGGLPAIAVVAAAFFGTNYMAHGSWRPPYAHRGDGAVVARVAADKLPPPRPGKLSREWRDALRKSGITLGENAEWQTTGKPGRWALWELATGRRWAVTVDGASFVIREWDDWYDYAHSYWREENRRGVDRGEPNAAVYAFHVLVGHHGVFSLTPFWVLSVWGLWRWLRRGDAVQRNFALLAAVLTLVCIAFFLTRPQGDRNYGGVTTGFRWLFWLIPMWLGAAIPAVARMQQRRSLRCVVYAAVFISVVSATYGALNPWTHPWLYQYWSSLGWIH